METTVRDAPDADRYEIRDGDRLLGIAAYQLRDDEIRFTHTEVDPGVGEKGLGSTLVRAALDDVRGRGLHVVPLCPFVRGWIERHPDYADLVVDGAVTRPLAAVLGRGIDPAEHDHVLGDPAAPVTVLEYGDYECPYCAAAAPVLRRLVEESEGGVRLVFRNFPLADKHPYALTAALAAEAAGAQGAFWPMHELVFARQDRLDDGSLRGYAEELGLDAERVVGEPAQPFADKVEADFAAGLAAGVAGTPTVFVDGRQFSGRVEIGALRRAVAASGAVADGAVPHEPGVEPGPRRQRRWPRRVR